MKAYRVTDGHITKTIEAASAAEAIEMYSIVGGNITATEIPHGTLCDLRDGGYIRPATAAEEQASVAAADRDGGVGAILVNGVTCYVA